ncbi:hypothetical protein NKY66_28535 [Sinorhizobium meliloti]|uniref:hypothetical protein n=1 Tax=Rhizobium meliloti TaxID=382 RepID=UPI00299F0E8A|nr:hypothetical protein [Sinorhizobium meliloti]
MQRERAAGQLQKPLELTDAAAARTRIDPASIVSCEALSSSCWVAGLRRPVDTSSSEAGFLI